MGYLNPVEIRGVERFASDASDAGVDGVLLVDLPPEEAGDLRAALDAHGIALILLASPTTPEARLRRLCDDAQGYLYFVSFAGVTGADRLDAGAASERLQRAAQPGARAGAGRLRHQGRRIGGRDGRTRRRRRGGQRAGRRTRRCRRSGGEATRFLAPLRAALDAAPGAQAA